MHRFVSGLSILFYLSINLCVCVGVCVCVCVGVWVGQSHTVLITIALLVQSEVRKNVTFSPSFSKKCLKFFKAFFFPYKILN